MSLLGQGTSTLHNLQLPIQNQKMSFIKNGNKIIQGNSSDSKRNNYMQLPPTSQYNTDSKKMSFADGPIKATGLAMHMSDSKQKNSYTSSAQKEKNVKDIASA